MAPSYEAGFGEHGDHSRIHSGYAQLTACLLQITFLFDFLVGFLDFAKSLCGKLCEFFGKTLGHNHVGMKLLDELLITRFDFLV